MSDSEQPDRPAPSIRPISGPLPVPVFNLVVYVRHDASQVVARAANLPDLQASAVSEPLALKCLIEEAKRRLSAWHNAGEVIPWLATPLSRVEEEAERYIPLHL